MSDSPVKATDVLANERTYLAYLRTALAFVGFGFVIARFALFSRELSTVASQLNVPSAGSSRYLGTAMVLFGVACGIFGSWRYAVSDRALREGRVSTLSPRVAYGIALAIGLVGAVIALYLFL